MNKKIDNEEVGKGNEINKNILYENKINIQKFENFQSFKEKDIL